MAYPTVKCIKMNMKNVQPVRYSSDNVYKYSDDSIAEEHDVDVFKYIGQRQGRMDRHVVPGALFFTDDKRSMIPKFRGVIQDVTKTFAGTTDKPAEYRITVRRVTIPNFHEKAMIIALERKWRGPYRVRSAMSAVTGIPYDDLNGNWWGGIVNVDVSKESVSESARDVLWPSA
jgi:hypothetical protein